MNDTPPSERVRARSNPVDPDFVDENDSSVPYTKLPRAYGDGELRVGTFLALSEDIYSLGFVSQIRNDIIDKALMGSDADRP